MAGITEAGEAKAWDLIASRDPAEIAAAAAATYDVRTRRFLLRSYGMGFAVAPDSRLITGTSEEGSRLLSRHGELFRLSALWYLASAKDIPCTGRLAGIESIRGGQAFSRGSHVLPLEKLAERYKNDKEGFLERAALLGGRAAGFGDASATLPAFPRVPVTLTLWLADEEFPARAGLLLDSSCDLQLPPDITWSVALMSVIVML